MLRNSNFHHPNWKRLSVQFHKGVDRRSLPPSETASRVTAPGLQPVQPTPSEPAYVLFWKSNGPFMGWGCQGLQC